MAAALQARNTAGDAAQAAVLIAALESGETFLGSVPGGGMVAASHDGLAPGAGDTYPAAPHVGTTAWYLLAKQGVNPSLIGRENVGGQNSVATIDEIRLYGRAITYSEIFAHFRART